MLSESRIMLVQMVHSGYEKYQQDKSSLLSIQRFVEFYSLFFSECNWIIFVTFRLEKIILYFYHFQQSLEYEDPNFIIKGIQHTNFGKEPIRADIVKGGIGKNHVEMTITAPRGNKIDGDIILHGDRVSVFHFIYLNFKLNLASLISWIFTGCTKKISMML